MSHTQPKPLAKVTLNRRQDDRRRRLGESVLSQFLVFTRAERDAWRRIDRRISIRRQSDIRRRIAQQK